MSADLERRYRRLLRAYPASHRAVHGQEMLGVLLDAAASRARPGLADAVDVLRGGLLVRARRADAAGWGDALAVVAAVTSMLVSTLAPLGLGLLLFSAYAPTAGSVALMAWPLAVAAGLAGLRRTGAALGVAATLALVATGALTWWSGPWTALATIAAATTGATGARRGWRVLGRARAAELVAGCVLIGGFLLVHARVVADHWRRPYLPGPLDPREQMWLLLGTGLLLVGAASVRVGTPAARRATLLLAAPLAALALGLLAYMALFDERIAPIADLQEATQPMVIAVSLVVATAFAAKLPRRPGREQARRG